MTVTVAAAKSAPTGPATATPSTLSFVTDLLASPPGAVTADLALPLERARCESCGARSSVLMAVRFDDGEIFEVCGQCAPASSAHPVRVVHAHSTRVVP